MPLSLIKLAERNNIKIVYWDFKPPLDAVYLSHPGAPPHIGISERVISNTPYFRCVLAEELGHHFTTAENALTKPLYLYSDRLNVSKVEHKALRWAAQYLMPSDKLFIAMKEGLRELWELADYFNVTKEMVHFRLNLPDLRRDVVCWLRY